ncbi:hypothetical protein CAEBREN_07000 [Caenorhabditis brenneri]|uniref:Uncharacterized protein n=1 Tax=Caenorhabditis brenneri TaxID=135651 RepID=G0MJE5_CAEBE|nr:hypothetical protein CAEBREN_07000 [Caenorhabditis brenneri]
MEFASIFLLTILAIGVLSTDLQPHSQIGSAGYHHGFQETNTRTMMSNPALHPRFRRWGYYGGYGGGFGRGFGMGGFGRYGGYYG